MLLSKENQTLLNLIIIQQSFGAGSVKAVKYFNLLRDENLLENIFVKDKIQKIIPTKDADKLLTFNINTAHKIIDDCLKNNINILTICDTDYPQRLRNIPDCPILLYIKGELPPADTLPMISIVGPRKISDFGKKAAFSLAKRLTKGGIIVVSGAALGADTSAHKGALSVGGKTVAILGCGICCNYLSENRSLRNTISQNGCLISEYPPYASATKYTFPIRNRIISAISLGTVVIEASLKSGSLITARLANEQGRDVFVIPGNPTNDNYKGSNLLLRDGAIPLLDAKDIFNEYLSSFPEQIDIEKAFEKDISKTNVKLQKKLKLGLSKDAEMVYNSLDKRKFTADDLLALSLNEDDILSALTELEIEGVIKALPGGVYEVVYKEC